jgi:hypothetical protein
MWRPGKLRFLIGVKNPLPIGRLRSPENTAPCGAAPVALILIDVLFSSCSPLNNPCCKEIRFVWDLEISLASLENQINKVL